MKRFEIVTLCLAALCGIVAAPVAAEEGKSFKIGEKYELTAPANWIVKQPKSNIIEFEFEVPVAEGDEIPGRVTVMGAGGGIDANVDRWKGQFKAPAEGEVKAERKDLEIAGQPVHIVDIKGTYMDKPGPFVPGPGTERPDYRMLGAIITTKDAGQYFVKLYGPAKTIGAAEPSFKKMIEGMQAK